MTWKGILLAGGTGSRLFPITMAVTKQLLPIYDKPLIFYPLSVLMLAGIKEILIISQQENIEKYKNLFQDGSHLGVSIAYKNQEEPKGIAEAFIIGESFIGNDNVTLILGDNIFYGTDFIQQTRHAITQTEGATLFGYYVRDPQRYGVIEFDDKGIHSIEEKPTHPKSNYAVTGLYMYDNQVIDLAKNLIPSKRGELEITDINQEYINKNQLKLRLLSRGTAWLDTGTEESLLAASNFVETLEKRQGLKIACLEEIAYHMNYISKTQLHSLGQKLSKSPYGRYILNIAAQ